MSPNARQIQSRRQPRLAMVPTCPHRPPCPGCPRFGERGIAPAALEALDSLAHAHGLPLVSVVGGSTAGFRLRARLAIRGRMNSPKVGLFASASHRVVHIPNCIVHHPLINHVAGVVRRALVEARVSSYSDTPHLGLARYLQVVIERSSQTAQVVLVVNNSTPEPVAACLDLIVKSLAADLHSLWFNANGERSNTILGPDFQNWCGPESVIEHFGGAAVHYPPGAFGQNNLEIAGKIIDHVRTHIPHGARVAEFYAGVGAIGLSLLPHLAELRMNEIGQHSLHGLRLGLAQLDAANAAKISLIAGSAGEAFMAAAGADVVIADPPRKGLDPELTAYLREHPAKRFVYVSCGLESFLKDAAQLLAGAKLRVSSLAAFNLLPFTEHAEIVAVFDN